MPISQLHSTFESNSRISFSSRFEVLSFHAVCTPSGHPALLGRFPDDKFKGNIRLKLLIPGLASGVGVAFLELALGVEFIGRLLVIALCLLDETLVMSGHCGMF